MLGSAPSSKANRRKSVTGLDETMLNERAELAAEVCRKIKYGSLRTLETLFLQNGEMGFLEMNTRIVEHGVTEEVMAWIWSSSAKSDGGHLCRINKT